MAKRTDIVRLCASLRVAAAPIIVSGVAVGIAAVSTAGAVHLDDDHKRWGIAIFVLYFIQCALGALVHYVKPTSWTVRRKRPVQNYFHAILGLLVIGLAFYQVRSIARKSAGVAHLISCCDTTGTQWVHGGMDEGVRQATNQQGCQHRVVCLGCGKFGLHIVVTVRWLISTTA